MLTLTQDLAQGVELFVRDVANAERARAIALLQREWGATVIARDRVYEFDACRIFVAGDFEGVAAVSDEEAPILEIVAINAFQQWRGLGTALIGAISDFAASRGCTQLRLTTTNDNLDALRFYQRRGFHLAALRVGAVEEARKLKPSIPLTGDRGIPIRDELDLICMLDGRSFT